MVRLRFLHSALIGSVEPGDNAVQAPVGIVIPHGHDPQVGLPSLASCCL